jgi:hypothetical protein
MMIFEPMLFFGLGYFFARWLSINAKMNADILLYWNADCLGWRPLTDPSEMKEDMRYLAAIEIEIDSRIDKMK